RLEVAAEAVGRARLERLRRVAVAAAGDEVLAVELEARHRVVVEDVVAGLLVALLALVAEPALVGVVLGVAALGAAGGRRAVVRALRVAVRAVGQLGVQALERPLGVLGVIEAGRLPGAAGVAARALVAERALVQRVLVAAHAALGRRVLVAVVAVALRALHGLVREDERELRGGPVVELDRLLVELELAGLVAVLALGGLELLVLDGLVLVAAHARD